MKMFEEYLRQRLSLIKKNWKHYLESEEQECLHRMRVELKKLTAFFHFINETESGFELHAHSKLSQTLMDICGELRDQHNFQQLAEKYQLKITTVQAQMQQYESQQALNKLQLHYRKHHTGLTQLKKQLQPWAKSATAEQLEHYLSEFFEKMAKQRVGRQIKGGLHETRKKIKEIVYLQKVLAKKSKHVVDARKLAVMDELQDHIGQWHDLHKFEQRIHELKSGRIPKKTTDAFRHDEAALLSEIYKLSQTVFDEALESVSS